MGMVYHTGGGVKGLALCYNRLALSLEVDVDPADLCLLSLAEQSRLIRERQVSPVEVVGAALARIDQLFR